MVQVDTCTLLLLGLVIAMLLVKLYLRPAATKGADAIDTTQEFRKFQSNYLSVYLIMMGSDWLQGPYVYALYDSYGYSKGDISYLFIAGFGSAMVFGTVAGTFADSYGRKKNCLAFGIIYILSCVTKHFNIFWVLILGRVLGGIATSLLFSAFEAWLVCEHNMRGHDEGLLSQTFSIAAYWNGIVAIVAGVVAQAGVDYLGTNVVPFDMSMGLLAVGTLLVAFTWGENYGDKVSGVSGGVRKSLRLIISDPRILLCGMTTALFEGAMYTFVFMWTPALQGQLDEFPPGYVFAAFMVCVMIGSSLYAFLAVRWSSESFCGMVFAASAVSLAVSVLYPSPYVMVTCFCVFEVTVGVYWPSISMQRSTYIPESNRSTVMNIFRVPLNLIVVFVLVENARLSEFTIFLSCASWLLLAALSQLALWFYLSCARDTQEGAVLDADVYTALPVGGEDGEKPAAKVSV